ncbi:hypothetical protein BL250_10225 [Erwinia sp. OLTSP20]|uniref:thermonuclease family protein n=1 Tax=unclassified Erwinia TaxID=2622719 RepID=UPI000C185913|nr:MULTISPECIES: thermonuclease family protein [unclassified Erwinia]PIJ49781.1 hypothetical protein BV501_11355 [Erwinia sp. OAMSP11]PIJ70880.1 hypothetical protein BK416_12545 [Erwinia sp. OLSSP12]PIJ80245.1 hypothetical protein BLD47_11410 [Erwinia sp. OLCASP19]PIJ82369.1 hypothetical protein BLD46_11160 [Erwinia sp. OLMTSP26]PIJ85055.1 hypothetical protein BLD49_11270 [Erwinia sp. OLMDSP33]
MQKNRSPRGYPAAAKAGFSHKDTCNLLLPASITVPVRGKPDALCCLSALTCCLLVLCLALMPVTPARAAIRGQVVRVLDGDTVEVNSAHRRLRVRLAGIDAPEMGQTYGRRSCQALRALIDGRTVTLVGHQRDHYHRLLAVIWLNGEDINARQVATGMAWAYRFHQRAENAAYLRLERQARKTHVGLWQRARPMEPWRWRAGMKGRSHPAEPGRWLAYSRCENPRLANQ